MINHSAMALLNILYNNEINLIFTNSSHIYSLTSFLTIFITVDGTISTRIGARLFGHGLLGSILWLTVLALTFNSCGFLRKTICPLELIILETG